MHLPRTSENTHSNSLTPEDCYCYTHCTQEDLSLSNWLGNLLPCDLCEQKGVGLNLSKFFSPRSELKSVRWAGNLRKRVEDHGGRVTRLPLLA